MVEHSAYSTSDGPACWIRDNTALILLFLSWIADALKTFPATGANWCLLKPHGGSRDIPVKLWVVPPPKLGHIPSFTEYFDTMGIVNKDNAAIYKYLNFNQIDEYVENAKGVTA